MIKRQEPTHAILTNLYNTIHDIITDTDAYYTPDQIEALHNDPNNIFLRKEN